VTTIKSSPLARRDPRSAILMTLVLVAIVLCEAVSLIGYLERNDELRTGNDQLEAANRQTARHISELRSSAEKIAATFTRLNDGIVRVPGNEGRLPIPGGNPNEGADIAENRIEKAIRDYGLVVKPVNRMRHESSLTFEAGSNQLEFHRLLPFLAEQENSNAFLFLERVDLVRPAQVPAFSTNPTGLEARLLIRVLSGPK
jgi:hypothetical protein